MTLKEKLCEPFGGLKTETVNELEQIVVDFAIDFADWIRVCQLKRRSYDFDNIEELLTIYKEEKGL